MKPTQTITRSRSKDYSHTISGLLTIRADLYNDSIELSKKLAEIQDNLTAIDKTLGIIGYEGELDKIMPKRNAKSLFGRGELTKIILNELRKSDKILSTREIACLVIDLKGFDKTDRNFLTNITNTISRALANLRARDVVESEFDESGRQSWKIK